MFIQQVISYGNAWHQLVERFPKELEEIQSVVTDLSPESIAASRPLRDFEPYQEEGVTRYRLDGYWATALKSHGWDEFNSAINRTGGRPIHLRLLGYIKNEVSVKLLRQREILNRWLYTLAPIATRNGLIEIPVGIVLLQADEERLFGLRPMMSNGVFERTKEELLALSPLSHTNPFILIGIGIDDVGLNVIEIESEVENTSQHVVINRSIEFPPEYHQAGLGILNYFGTILREKYPESNAKVKIEQDGLMVRLVIESENGNREIIEKALQDYELVVRGESPPESLLDSKAKILELKNELRIAQVRIESKQDQIAYLNEELVSLRQIFGHALSSSRSQPISITVNPAITVNTIASIQLQQVVPELSDHVKELAALAATSPDVEMRLLDLDESLYSLAQKNTPEEVKKSSAIRKLLSFFDDAEKAGTTVNDFLNKVSDGVGVVQKLARKYNELASWCGAPQVPSILLGKDS